MIISTQLFFCWVPPSPVNCSFINGLGVTVTQNGLVYSYKFWLSVPLPHGYSASSSCIFFNYLVIYSICSVIIVLKMHVHRLFIVKNWILFLFVYSLCLFSLFILFIYFLYLFVYLFLYFFILFIHFYSLSSTLSFIITKILKCLLLLLSNSLWPHRL